jgi:Universal stress protein family
VRDVIVGIDRSHPSTSTLVHAVTAAEDHRTSLHVVMCTPRTATGITDPVRRELLDAEHFLLVFVRRLTVVDFTWMVGVGDLEPMVVAEAHRLRAVLVVLADDGASHLTPPSLELADGGIEVVRVPNPSTSAPPAPSRIRPCD